MIDDVISVAMTTSCSIRWFSDVSMTYVSTNDTTMT